MAMTFPSNPTTGQQYSVSGGPTYTWDGTVWKILTPGSQFSEQQFTATAGQTSFTVSGGYVIGAVDVYRNGVKLVIGLDYTATDLSTVVLSNAASAGDTIEVVKAAQILYADALKATNNLSDVGNAATARANLGAVSKAGDNFTGPVGIYGGRLYVGASATDYMQLGKDAGSNAFIDATKVDADFAIYLNSTSTGYNRKLWIDSSGRVSMPYQPAFNAYGSSGNYTQAVGVVPFGSTLVNRGGHFNTSNNRFTAPVSGVYYFSVGVWQNDTNADVRFYLSVNGYIVGFPICVANGTRASNQLWTGSMPISLTAGDYVEFKNGSVSILLYGYLNFFSGYLLG